MESEKTDLFSMKSKYPDKGNLLGKIASADLREKKNKGEKDYENETNQKITVINLLYDARCGYGIIYKRL